MYWKLPVVDSSPVLRVLGQFWFRMDMRARHLWLDQTYLARHTSAVNSVIDSPQPYVSPSPYQAHLNIAVPHLKITVPTNFNITLYPRTKK